MASWNLWIYDELWAWEAKNMTWISPKTIRSWKFQLLETLNFWRALTLRNKNKYKVHAFGIRVVNVTFLQNLDFLNHLKTFFNSRFIVNDKMLSDLLKFKEMFMNERVDNSKKKSWAILKNILLHTKKTVLFRKG